MPKAPTLHVEVVTPYGILFDGRVEMLIITAKDGEVGILPGHTPMMAALIPGELRLKIDQEWQMAVATDGYAEVGPDLTLIVVNAAELAQNIDVPRVEKALARAEAKLVDPATSQHEKLHAIGAIIRAKARLKVAQKYMKTTHST
jgi:F-type H+-transporting ATPase subunit epsilon